MKFLSQQESRHALTMLFFVRQGGSIGFEFARVGERGKRRGEHRFMKLMKPKKGGKLRCLLLRRKKIYLFIYDVITSPEKTKTLHLSLLMGRSLHVDWWNTVCR
jgi:hypothetical protein